MSKNIFEKIRDGEEPSEIVYKDEFVTAFHDIYPSAPIHILIIPNKTSNIIKIRSGTILLGQSISAGNR